MTGRERFIRDLIRFPYPLQHVPAISGRAIVSMWPVDLIDWWGPPTPPLPSGCHLELVTDMLLSCICDFTPVS